MPPILNHGIRSRKRLCRLDERPGLRRYSCFDSSQKPSVVQIRNEDLDPNVIGTQIVDALQRAQKELDAGAILTIEADRTRLRVLPFAIEP
jgi:hypothetical protein